MAASRRQLVMGGAAVVVLVLALSRIWTATAPAAPALPVETTSAARGPVASGGPAPGSTGPVKLAALAASRDEPGEAARNPFRFQAKAPPAPARPAVTTPVNEPPRGPAPPTGPPPAPAISLKLIGVLERANGVKWAVLSDGKSGPMYGKDGDIIDGRFLIVKIGTESIEMTHADGRGRQVIRLTGQ